MKDEREDERKNLHPFFFITTKTGCEKKRKTKYGNKSLRNNKFLCVRDSIFLLKIRGEKRVCLAMTDGG
jgi:hypothetical protein